MDESELTRKAVEEIMREMELHKEREQRPQQERKKNPLGRTNKHFLGRTLNAMVQHNKRVDEQTRRKCNKKLKALDEQRHSRHYKRRESPDRKSRHKKRRSHHSKDFSDSSATEYSYKRKKKHKKSKTKKKRKRHSSRSRSSSSSANNIPTESQTLISEYSYYDAEDVDYNAAYLGAPTLLDMQMQQFYQYKALMALSAAAGHTTSTNTVQTIELHSSSPSLSDIKLEETSSSSEEDSGEMLTINVTDSDEEDDNHTVPEKSTNNSDVVSASIEIVDSDCISVNSASSAESNENAIDLTED